MRAHQESGASGKRECWDSSRGQITINKGLKVEAEESGHPCLRKGRSFLCGDHMHQAACLPIPSVTFMKIEWGDEAKKWGGSLLPSDCNSLSQTCRRLRRQECG